MKSKKRKGMTLIELIAALAITPIVFGAIFQVTLSMYKTLKTLSDVSDVQEKSKTVMTDITHSLTNCRKYLDTDEAKNDQNLIVALNNIGVSLGSHDKIALYVEGYNNNRFMYVIKNNELYKYTFRNGVTQSHYNVFQFSDGSYAKYELSSDEFKNLKGKLNNSIEIKTGDKTSDIVKLPPGEPDKCSGDFIFYDDYDNNYYLYRNENINENETNYYKFELYPVTDWDTELIVPGKKINYIEDLKVTSDNNSRNKRNNCTVEITAEKNGKTKNIKTDVYVPLGSEG